MNEAPSPMLAHTFNGKFSFVGFSQPKLDGVRALANRAGLRTRSGVRITTCMHIEAALAPFFTENPSAILDGELYAHEFNNDLGRIISLVAARRPPSSSPNAASRPLQFHIFDKLDMYEPFSARWAWLSTRCTPQSTESVRFVKTTPVHSAHKVDALFRRYLDEGYEGQMLRRDVPYVPGRSSALVKRKPFIDEEFPVLAIDTVRGQSTAYAKRVTLALPDGRTFKAGISGSHEYAATLLRQPCARATIRYSTRSANGIPRSPVAVAFYSPQ